MIENNVSTKIRNISAKITSEQINNIKYYIKGSVYSFCNNCKNENGGQLPFAAYKLFGEDNYYWQDPLIALYDYYHEIRGLGLEESVAAAGKDIGLLLKLVLQEDPVRTYRQLSAQRKYEVNAYVLIDSE